MINGVDPNAADGVNESGSDIRGEQNIGRSGEWVRRARRAGRPAAVAPCPGLLDDLLGGLLHATRSRARRADRGMPPTQGSR